MKKSKVKIFILVGLLLVAGFLVQNTYGSSFKVSQTYNIYLNNEELQNVPNACIADNGETYIALKKEIFDRYNISFGYNTKYNGFVINDYATGNIIYILTGINYIGLNHIKTITYSLNYSSYELEPVLYGSDKEVIEPIKNPYIYESNCGYISSTILNKILGFDIKLDGNSLYIERKLINSNSLYYKSIVNNVIDKSIYNNEDIEELYINLLKQISNANSYPLQDGFSMIHDLKKLYSEKAKTYWIRRDAIDLYSLKTNKILYKQVPDFFLKLKIEDLIIRNEKYKTDIGVFDKQIDVLSSKIYFTTTYKNNKCYFDTLGYIYKDNQTDKFLKKYFTQDPTKLFRLTELQWKNLNSKGLYQGMTKEAFLLYMGSYPEDTNTTVVGGSTIEQLIYYNYSCFYYFKNGILTSWQFS